MLKWSILSAATLATAASVSFVATAVAADIEGKTTRNWSGTWFGFGAGYSNSGYKGDLGSTACFTGATGSGSHQSQAGCDAVFDGTGGGVGVGATAETIGTNPSKADSSAAVAIAPPNFAAGTAVAGGTSSSSVNTSVDVDASVISAMANAISLSGDQAVSTQIADDGTGGDQVVGIEETGDVNYAAESVTFYDPSSGVFGAAAVTGASSTDGSASAFALGFEGLPGGGFSDDAGGFTPNIHMRIDHQTESNWVFGGELDLLFPTGSDLTATRDTDVALSLQPGGPVEQIDLTANQAVSVDTNLLATARLRMGYATGDYLFYGTGGIAYADLDAEATARGAYSGLYGSRNVSTSQSKTAHAWGGVVGGGVSAFMAEDTVVSLEGLYYMFDKTINVGDGAVKLDDAFSVMMKVSIRPN